MGIDIEVDGRVKFNGAHERLLNTSVDKNPSLRVIKGLAVQCVFRRVQTHGDVRDGNPFIFALKEKKGFRIDRKELWQFRENFSEILKKALDEIEVDLIVPMPSGHKIALYLARRVSRSQRNVASVVQILRKRTVAEMLDEYGGRVPDTSEAKVRGYRKQIKIWKKMPSGTLVSMKDVENHVRKFFRPLAYLDTDLSVAGKRILLVDDLLSSGATLKCAQFIVEERGASHVSALSLLSGL